MTAHKVEPAIIDPGRKMSIAEVARGVREGRFVVHRLRKWNDGVYRLYIGTPDKVPDWYDLEETGNDVLIIRLGKGPRRILKRKKDAWVTIPAKYAKGREGPVLVERVDEKTLVVYLG